MAMKKRKPVAWMGQLISLVNRTGRLVLISKVPYLTTNKEWATKDGLKSDRPIRVRVTVEEIVE